MKYSSIIFRTAKVFKECQIRSFPIDCMEILKHYSYRVYSYSYIKSRNPRLFKLCGGYSNDAFTEKSLKIIAFNDSVSLGRIRFSLMHELGHIMLGHTGQEPDCEFEANLFASNILAPRVMIQRLGCQNSADVQKTFGMSAAAANIAWIDFMKFNKQDYQKEDIELLHWFDYQPTLKTQSNTPSFFDLRWNEIQKEKNLLGINTLEASFMRAEHYWLYGDIY